MVSSNSNSNKSKEPFVRVENLTFTYPTGERPSLNDVSFTVEEGEFIGITGPSGAGKSTLCLALRGLIPHSVAGKVKGKVWINGIDVAQATAPKVGEIVGLVFQNPEAQIIGLTVEEDLAFGPENYEWPLEKLRAKIPEKLSVVRMSGTETRETWSLSGGQKQRVSIASSLILEPKLLILDEPTSELDPVGKEEVFETVRRLREEENVTIIMVEHAVENLAEVADRIIVMDNGQIVGQGPPSTLFRNVGLFHEIEGERLPQIAEILFTLEQEGYITSDQFTPYEDQGLAVLKELLEDCRGE